MAALTYGSYLKLDQLLDLQQPLSDGPEHDETLFIVIHQVYELWFKQELHELAWVQRSLDDDKLARAGSTLRRMLTILKTLVSQIDVLETMTPLQFSSFRERLASSSGFQSVQFRELELRLGLRGRERLATHAEGSPGRARLEAALREPTLYDAFLRFLHRRGHEMPAEVLSRDLAQPLPVHAGVRAALMRVYREDDALAALAERLVDLDEGVQEWRYRHVKMVERTIGAKMGTGGSEGAEYLKRTLFAPIFPDLWTIRGEF